ncbi:arabinose operon transcriptional regulator AraC [Kosakonia cowanii]|uniref:arabinose operon transcriptional regulator AraC n=1 Tax=Kosakonia cowanii TaxID=208223 RepID=UPI001F500CE4|nr:arabinose operon transcriptional regulator AraC [Kosakonia cowanii]
MWPQTLPMNDVDDELLIYSPLMRSFTFNAYLVAGYTPIVKGNKLDFFINRQQGMKGYILNITLRGAGVIHRNNETFICRENDILLFPPGCPHHYGREAQSTYWDHLWIYFIPRPYWIDWLKWDRNWHQIGLTQSADVVFVEQLKTAVKEVIQLNSSPDRVDKILAMNSLEKALLYCFKQQPASNRASVDPRINAICQYLDENLAAKLTISELAAKAYLSSSRLAHLFRQEIGMTIWGWREKQRMSRAAMLLQHTQLTISQIAQVVGYDDALYFSRLFHQQYHVGPREYRKRYEQLHSL